MQYLSTSIWKEFQLEKEKMFVAQSNMREKATFLEY